MTTVLFHFAMKKINIIIITRGFYRRQKHEEARRVNYQFKVHEGQVYANIGEVLDPPPPNSHRHHVQSEVHNHTHNASGLRVDENI